MVNPETKRLARCVVALSMLVLSACGGSGGSGSPPPPPPPTPSTYGVGGTVSGLNGTVVLQNNAGNDLTVNTNGTFAFTTTLAAGSSYNITVRTQPASPPQVCTVSNGAGTVPSGNVTSVSIACANVPLTLSSSTPTAGATDVARNAIPALLFSAAVDPATAIAANITLSTPTGNQAITLGVSGTQVTVTPSSNLQPETLYTLNVSTAVRGSGGEQLTGPITVTFTTRGGAWGTPTMIELDNAGHAQSPQTVIGASGNALAVWQQSDGTRDNIWSNRYDPAGGWRTAALLENTGGEAFSAEVGLDDNGNGFALWQQSDGTRYNVLVSRYDSADGWSTPAQIESDPNDTADAQLAVSTRGSAVAVWSQSNGSRYVVWANRYTPGSGWPAPTRIQTDVSSDGFFPQVATDASGNATVVWHQSDGTRYNIWAIRHSPGSGWGTAEIIETDNSGDAMYPQVGMDSSGNAIAVWQHFDGVRFNVMSNRYIDGGAWGTPVQIESNDGGSAFRPQIGVDAAGNALVVWLQDEAGRLNVWSNRYTAGGAWGTAALIETDNTGDADYPQIAINASGVAHAIWKQRDSTHYNILANRFVPGSGWGTATAIENDASGNAQDPQIAINASGTAQAIWVQFDGMRFNVWANRFE